MNIFPTNQNPILIWVIRIHLGVDFIYSSTYTPLKILNETNKCQK